MHHRAGGRFHPGVSFWGPIKANLMPHQRPSIFMNWALDEEVSNSRLAAQGGRKMAGEMIVKHHKLL
jgi:hypothetical protein